MARWQYKVVRQRVLPGAMGPDTGEDLDREALLNRYGRDGWELVSVNSHTYRRDYDPTSMQGYATYSYFFRREDA